MYVYSPQFQGTLYTTLEFLSPSEVFAIYARSRTLFLALLATLKLCFLAMLLNSAVNSGMFGTYIKPCVIFSSSSVLSTFFFFYIASLTSFFVYSFSTNISSKSLNSSSKYGSSHIIFALSLYSLLTPLLILSLWLDLFFIFMLVFGVFVVDVEFDILFLSVVFQFHVKHCQLVLFSSSSFVNFMMFCAIAQSYNFIL